MMATSGRLQPVRIVFFAMFAAIVYGVLHDMVTAHLCVEYFTIAHPPIYLSDSPIVMALAWGVIATWWVGAALGVALAIAARVGSAPKIDLAELKWPVVKVMLISGAAAVLALLVGAGLYAIEAVHISQFWESRISPAKHHAFIAVAWAHTASYIVGALAGLTLVIRTGLDRYRAHQAS